MNPSKPRRRQGALSRPAIEGVPPSVRKSANEHAQVVLNVRHATRILRLSLRNPIIAHRTHTAGQANHAINRTHAHSIRPNSHTSIQIVGELAADVTVTLSSRGAVTRERVASKRQRPRRNGKASWGKYLLRSAFVTPYARGFTARCRTQETPPPGGRRGVPATERPGHSAEVDLGFEVGTRVRVGQGVFQFDAALPCRGAGERCRSSECPVRRSGRSLP